MAVVMASIGLGLTYCAADWKTAHKAPVPMLLVAFTLGVGLPVSFVIMRVLSWLLDSENKNDKE